MCTSATGSSCENLLKFAAANTTVTLAEQVPAGGFRTPGTAPGAQNALTQVKTAINQLAQDRATIGAYQTRLSATAEQLMVNKENLTAATSRIMDVDVAEESTEFARRQILVQSGTAMLAQANALPQTALRLLQ